MSQEVNDYSFPFEPTYPNGLSIETAAPNDPFILKMEATQTALEIGIPVAVFIGGLDESIKSDLSPEAIFHSLT